MNFTKNSIYTLFLVLIVLISTLYLNKNGVETRPIISGNFLNQPSIKLYKLNSKKEFFKGAQEIENRGFFIGIHVNKITERQLKLLENKLLKIDEI